jgi:WD40 repeat protein
VAARPVGAVARFVRACRRRPLVTTLLALLAISLIGGASGITWKWLEANDQRDLANTKARQADNDKQAALNEKQAALYQAYRASLAAASASLQDHDVADAARLLKLAPEELRDWEWHHLHGRLDDSSAVVPLPAGWKGYLIAAPDKLRVGVLTSTGLRVTNLEGDEQRNVPISPERRDGVSVAQTRRGFRAAAWIDDTAFDLLNEAGQLLCRVNLPGNKGHALSGVAMSPDGTRLACVSYPKGASSQIAVFDANSGKQTALCADQTNGFSSITFSPDGSRLATGSGDGTAQVWDAVNGTLVATCLGHTNTVLHVAFSPDGARLLTASRDMTVRQWDARTGREAERPYERHGAILYCAVYSPDGQWVASGGEDRTIRVWRAQGLEDVAVLHGHLDYVVEVAFTPDGRRLVSRSSHLDAKAWQGPALVWDLDPRAALPVLRGHKDGVYPVAYSSDGRWLASGSWDHTVRVWDAATGELCAILPHDRSVEGLAFGPDGNWLVTGCNADNCLRVWDVATTQVRKKIPFDIRNSHALTVSPDGTRLATRDYDWGTGAWRLSVFDIASCRLLCTTNGSALAYSPDGRWLAATAPDEKTLLLLDARTHEAIDRFSGHEKAIFKAVFSPDSSLLASCSQDHTVRLWQIGNGKCQVLEGHTDVVYAVTFHPDGTRLATAARDGVIWLWDVARGEEVVRLRGHEAFVWSLAFSPDGATLASGSGDKTVRLWDSAPLKTRYQARREAAALRPEAERLVQQLWRKHSTAAKVVGALRADPALSEALRQAALRAVLRRTKLQEAAASNSQWSP